MKALTICQPYAHLIVRGEKRVENREWSTDYRGPLVIHAGKNRSWMDDEDEEEFRALRDPLVFGAIVGVAQLTGCLHIKAIHAGRHDAQYPWIRLHEHTNGTWCWVLEKVTRLAQPIPYRGGQGLFFVPDNIFGGGI